MANGLQLRLVQNASYYYNGSGNSTDFNDARHYLSLVFSLEDSNANQKMTRVTYSVKIIDEKTNHVILDDMFHSQVGSIRYEWKTYPIILLMN